MAAGGDQAVEKLVDKGSLPVPPMACRATICVFSSGQPRLSGFSSRNRQLLRQASINMASSSVCGR